MMMMDSHTHTCVSWSDVFLDPSVQLMEVALLNGAFDKGDVQGHLVHGELLVRRAQGYILQFMASKVRHCAACPS